MYKLKLFLPIYVYECFNSSTFWLVYFLSYKLDLKLTKLELLTSKNLMYKFLQ